MDYLEWCQKVFERVARLVMEGNEIERNSGVSAFGLPEKMGVNLNNIDPRTAVEDARYDLVEAQVLRMTQSEMAVTLSAVGEALVNRAGYDLCQIWPTWFQLSRARQEDLELLQAAVRISEERHESYAVFKPRQMPEVFAAAGRTYTAGDATGAFTRLKDQGLIFGMLSLGGGSIRPTYRGVVLATQKALSELQELVSKLEQKWEVASVDFKRKLSVGTDRQKAEFVKDVIALANTQQEARRFLMIGWDNATRAVFPPGIDPNIREEQLQQILGSYTDPVPTVTLQKVEYKGSIIGVIEVIREPWKIPYRVSRAIGRLQAGDIFVRHGTVTEAPTPDEQAALQAEGDRARQRQGGP